MASQQGEVIRHRTGRAAGGWGPAAGNRRYDEPRGAWGRGQKTEEQMLNRWLGRP